MEENVSMDELQIISLFLKGNNRSPFSTPYTDDCALIDHDIVITTDALAEHTHFRREWYTPEEIASKLFHVNLSDLVASGGTPEWCLLNLGLPQQLEEEFLVRFSKRLLDEIGQYGCRLVGGDTFRTSTLLFALTLGGHVTGRYVPRTGGRIGDTLYLTGSVGLALAGYEHLAGITSLSQEEPALVSKALERHLRPRARTEWAARITGNEQVHAVMDLSDGLVQDAKKLAIAGNMALEIDLEKIPVDPAIAAIVPPEKAVQSGEEFELLFLAESELRFDFPCTQIGRAIPGQGVRFLRNGTPFPLEENGFHHFS